jgi:carbon starvation protein CstA
LLAGRKWSRTSAIVALVSVIPTFLLMIRFIDPRVRYYNVYFGIFNNLLATISIVTVIPIVYFLCQQETRHWFLFAERLRAEHRRRGVE